MKNPTICVVAGVLTTLSLCDAFTTQIPIRPISSPKLQMAQGAASSKEDDIEKTIEVIMKMQNAKVEPNSEVEVVNKAETKRGRTKKMLKKIFKQGK